MDSVHLHLLINHVPTFVTIFSVFIMLWGMIKSGKSFVNLALIGFIIAGVFSLIAVQSGEAAEDVVEKLAGVSDAIIHDHEEAAEWAYLIAIFLGLLSIGGFVINKYKPSYYKSIKILIIVVGFISAGILSYTAYMGGQIRHSEIRGDETSAVIDPPESIVQVSFSGSLI